MQSSYWEPLWVASGLWKAWSGISGLSVCVCVCWRALVLLHGLLHMRQKNRHKPCTPRVTAKGTKERLYVCVMCVRECQYVCELVFNVWGLHTYEGTNSKAAAWIKSQLQEWQKSVFVCVCHCGNEAVWDMAIVWLCFQAFSSLILCCLSFLWALWSKVGHKNTHSHIHAHDFHTDFDCLPHPICLSVCPSLGYQISYRLDSRDPQRWTTVEVGSNARQFTVTGLSPEQTYVFRLTARTAVGWGEEQEALVVTTERRGKGHTHTHLSFTWYPVCYHVFL